LSGSRWMKNKLLLGIFCLLSASELWSYPSLLLTAEEIRSIHANLPSQSLSPSGRLFLSAILYVDATHWTVWINNSPLRPESSRDIEGFHIEEVLPRGVTFSWISPKQPMPIIFTLHPGQTYKREE
jgi:hypothetical protein